MRQGFGSEADRVGPLHQICDLLRPLDGTDKPMCSTGLFRPVRYHKDIQVRCVEAFDVGVISLIVATAASRACATGSDGSISKMPVHKIE